VQAAALARLFSLTLVILSEVRAHHPRTESKKPYSLLGRVH
jgi:hypothetical protein